MGFFFLLQHGLVIMKVKMLHYHLRERFVWAGATKHRRGEMVRESTRLGGVNLEITGTK